MKKFLLLILCLTALVFGVNKKYIRPQVNTVGLIAHYKLWAGLMASGKVFDYSLNGSTGTVTAATADYPGFDFNGSAHIDCGSAFQSTFQSNFSISFWLKVDDGTPSSNEGILGLRDAGNTNRVFLTLEQLGKLSFVYEANDVAANTAQSAAAVEVESWTNLVIVADDDNDQLSIYKDGAVVTLDGTNDGDASGVTFAFYTSSNNLFLGGRNNDGTVEIRCNGKIDDVMIFSKALSAVEVKNIYNVMRWRYSI